MSTNKLDQNAFYLSSSEYYPYFLEPILARLDKNDRLPLEICPKDYFIKNEHPKNHQRRWVVDYDNQLHLIDPDVIANGIKIPNMRLVDLHLCAYSTGILFFCLNEAKPTLENHVTWCDFLNKALYRADQDWTLIKWKEDKPEPDNLFSHYEQGMAEVHVDDDQEDFSHGIIWPDVNVEYLLYKAFEGRVINMPF